MTGMSDSIQSALFEAAAPRALAYYGRKILLEEGAGDTAFPVLPADLLFDEFDEFDFEQGGRRYHVLDAANARALADRLGGRGVWMDMRQSWQRLGDELWAAASKGAELRHFGVTTRFCASCGTPLERSSGISRRCPHCRREYWPAMSPAVIVLVKRGEEALLVHARNFAGPFYALVAGFVETGETLEECVAREIREETSLEVKDIRYFGSQSWPFPSQLMLGFTAEYAGGDLRWADGELTDGGFFRRDNVPQLPRLPSISRRLIDSWLQEK